MTIYMLIVEDNEAFVEELATILDELPQDIEYKVVRSREEAFEQVAAEFLDLVILDLAIPTIRNALDADPKHGYAVLTRIRTVAPGTPIFVLTGSSAEDFIEGLLRNRQQMDIWGEGTERGNIFFHKKYELADCREQLSPIAEAIDGLSQVEVDRVGLSLTIAEDRLIRIFAKKCGGVRCVVSGLGGGLSGTRVTRLRVTDGQGAQVHDAVVKLAGLHEVRREGECYDKFMARLEPAATPRKLAMLEFGAYDLAGIFFGLADGFEESAFDVAKRDGDRTVRMIGNVKRVTARWIAGVPETRRTIRQFREKLLDDDTLKKLTRFYGLDWVAEFERKEIQSRWGCGHGDLHGCNILVSDNDAIVLIDYGDVGEGPAALDPVTLELSLLFHPDGAGRSGEWPSVEHARTWGELETYVAGSPFAEFVSECRRWALAVAAGKREVAACAYSYLVRQLKYEDTNKDVALALLEGVRSFYEAGT